MRQKLGYASYSPPPITNIRGLNIKIIPNASCLTERLIPFGPKAIMITRMIYDLTDLKVRQDGRYTYYTASCKEYGFENFSIRRPIVWGLIRLQP
jgi:hypothetical protein